MTQALTSALIVAFVGFMGSGLGEAYFYLFAMSAMTGCIVYELETMKKGK